MMTQFWTLDDIKANSRIDGNEEDSLLERFAGEAEDVVVNYIERGWDEILDEYGRIPDSIIGAMLLYCDHRYHHRGITNPTQLHNVPWNITALLNPYVKLTR